jgi:hypothetical protein
MEEVPVKECLGEVVTIIGGADLFAEGFEALAIGCGDFGGDGIEEGKGGEEVLFRAAGVP